jgi:uncharacterized Tic20 family protein
MEENNIKIDDQNLGVIIHLSLLLGILIPFGGYAATLLLWLFKKDSSEYINAQGKEAVNFMLNIIVVGTAAMLLCVMLIGFLIMIPLVLVAFLLPVIAALKTSKGQIYRYPWVYRLIK